MNCYLTKLNVPHPLKRADVKRLRARLTHVIAAFLHKQAPKVAGQVVVLRGKFLQKDLTRDQQDQFDHIMKTLDFSSWTTLVGDVDDILEEIFKEGSYTSLAELRIGAKAKANALELAGKDAVDYAENRAAEMVGMRIDELGRLYPNPNAQWQITEATRDMLRGDVREALEQGLSNDVLQTRIIEGYAFSDSRAMTIARTETIKASNQGALASYAASGVVEQKEWVTAEDDLVSEDCEANGDAGPVALDAEFPSGDETPPAHPNCRCVIVPIVAFEHEEQES